MYYNTLYKSHYTITLLLYHYHHPHLQPHLPVQRAKKRKIVLFSITTNTAQITLYFIALSIGT